jgi:hypothetical protein
MEKNRVRPFYLHVETRWLQQISPKEMADGSDARLRGSKDAALVTMDGHSRYQEAVYRGNVYIAANQGAQTWSIALATGHTGLCLSNPAGSSKLLSILFAGHFSVAAPGGIVGSWLGGGFIATGVTAHTASLTPYNAQLGNPNLPVAKACSQETLTGTPVYLIPLFNSQTSGQLPKAIAPALIDIGGVIQVSAGAYVFIAAYTVCSGIGCIVWEEIPV